MRSQFVKSLSLVAAIQPSIAYKLFQPMEDMAIEKLQSEEVYDMNFFLEDFISPVIDEIVSIEPYIGEEEPAMFEMLDYEIEFTYEEGFAEGNEQDLEAEIIDELIEEEIIDEEITIESMEDEFEDNSLDFVEEEFSIQHEEEEDGPQEDQEFLFEELSNMFDMNDSGIITDDVFEYDEEILDSFFEEDIRSSYLL